MLRVLHVSAGAERGGLEVIFLNIVKSLDRSRFTPQVLFLTDGPFVNEVRETGIATHVVEAGRVRQILTGGRALARMTRLIREEGIDIVHTHNAKSHVYGGLAARFARVPCLLHLQGAAKPSFSRDGLVSFLSVAVPARQTIACSRWVADAFTSAWGLKRDVRVVYSGVIPHALSGANGATTVFQEFGIPDEAPLVVMATRLQRWKGVHIFIDAAARVVQEVPEARFMVVGGSLFGLEESYAEDLRRQANRLGLERSVLFTGFRSDVSRFFAASDILVHSSIEPDPFPTVILEAMACAKPVVAPDLGGPREMIEHGLTGVLIPPDDPEPLAQAILTLLADRETRVRMGRAGAERVRARFSASRMTRDIESIYLDMVNGRATG
jgi:glycosyltransferase involved in cell wall biosynthesis